MSNNGDSALERYQARLGKVLQFYGYFKEAVNEASSLSYAENFRVRKVNINYYLEDSTMEFVERKTDNSGMVQGNLIKRHLIEKGVGTGEVFGLDDLHIGGDITIYSRTYHITGCNLSTRRYLAAERGDEIPDTCVTTMREPGAKGPDDLYTRTRAEQQTRDTGNDHTVSRNKRMHGMKKFMEATLGNTVNLKGLGGFLDHGRDVLRFAAIWDDRESLYGDRLQYYVHFFLSDGSLEVLERHSQNNGRDPFPLLVKRQRCKRAECWGMDDANGRGDTEADAQYISWADLAVGRTVHIYGRDMELVDADAFTREWYAAKGPEYTLDEEVNFEDRDRAARAAARRGSGGGGPALTEEEDVAARLAVPPPFNGWGTERDSLENTRWLVPKPPKTPFDVFGQKLESHTLRFKAFFDPATVSEQDRGREFIIDYYTHDNTLQITEPPQRNSGVIGGKFLKKREYKDTLTGKMIMPEDLVRAADTKAEGGRVHVNHSVFMVTAVDQSTRTLMRTHQDGFNQTRPFDPSTTASSFADMSVDDI
jgi:hypothetical protein